MSALPTSYPRVPLKQMDPSMLVFELNRETARLMPEACELITSAATMASFCHRNQTRLVRGDLPRVPYIEHPLRVALRLIRWGVVDAEIIAGALLHDVLEDCADELLEVFGHDCESAVDCLRHLYGNRVADLVDEVTNPTDGTSYDDHIGALAETGTVALIIKASDLKDNAGSIQHQLGHDKDKKLLRMIAKYFPNITRVDAGLAIIDRRLDEDDTPFRRARLELSSLGMTLLHLADENSVDVGV